MDLFENQMVRNARNSMSSEVLAEYRKIGEDFYKNMEINENQELIVKQPDPKEEAVAQLSELIKAGLHPSYMNEIEHELLKDVYGEKWFEKFGYHPEDLKDISTITTL